MVSFLIHPRHLLHLFYTLFIWSTASFNPPFSSSVFRVTSAEAWTPLVVQPDLVVQHIVWTETWDFGPLKPFLLRWWALYPVGKAFFMPPVCNDAGRWAVLEDVHKEDRTHALLVEHCPTSLKVYHLLIFEDFYIHNVFLSSFPEP